MEAIVSSAHVLENRISAAGDRPAVEPISKTGKINSSETSPRWSASKKFGFRFAAVFFFLSFASPLDWRFWRVLFRANWIHFQDLLRLVAFFPQYVAAPKWGFASFGSVYLVLLVAAVGAVIWSVLDRSRRDYDAAFYWLRVLLRYRLAIALVAFGLLQVFPVQFPKPSLSDFHTNYGDYLQWKLYYLTNGIAHAHYEEALGLLEVAGGVLLLWRKTTTIGVIVSASLLLNIVLANFAYQLGDHVFATLLLAAAVFLLLRDGARLLDLLVFERRAQGDRYSPHFRSERAVSLRLAGKSAVLLFLALYGASVAYGIHHTNWPYPDTPAPLKNAEGYYNVREFTVNGRAIPYSLTDPVRWQNVVFEKWNTISIRSNRPVPLDVARPEIAYGNDQYEFAGNDGRRFYSYTADTGAQTLHLQGRNDPSERLSLHYRYASDGSLVLSGLDQSGNSLRVVLDKLDKQYLLLLGRRHPLTIY
jgi:hypothetical protein